LPSNAQNFVLSPRDQSMPFEEVSRIISAVPGVRVTQLDPKNRIAVIAVPEHLSAAVQQALQDRFLIDPNATLGY
jgi:hypothetical protein